MQLRRQNHTLFAVTIALSLTAHKIDAVDALKIRLHLLVDITNRSRISIFNFNSSKASTSEK